MFFKSIWFKCISCLLVLAVVLSGILAVLNDVLAVSEKERTDRAITKIYGEIKDYTAIDILEDKKENAYGTIDTLYDVEGDLLFKSTGKQGYKGGTITLWINVKTNENGNYEITKIIQDSYEKQTLMSKFTKDYYENFLKDVTAAYESGTYIFAPKAQTNKIENAMTGATYSANAACNAVNCVIEYLVGGNAQ